MLFSLRDRCATNALSLSHMAVETNDAPYGIEQQYITHYQGMEWPTTECTHDHLTLSFCATVMYKLHTKAFLNRFSFLTHALPLATASCTLTPY